VPPPPLLWVSLTGQEQRSVETSKKALESPLKEKDMMVSINQVLLQPTEVSSVTSGNDETPLVQEYTRKTDNRKEVLDFVEAKGDSDFKVQGETVNKCKEPTREVMKSKLDICPAIEVKKGNPGPTAALKDEKGAVAPTPSANSGRKNALPKKTVLPKLVHTSVLTEQPSAPPPAVVSQELSQPNPCPGSHLVVLPVAPLVSPSHFGLRLVESEEEVSKLVEIMTANPPSMVPGWTIDKNQGLALLHNKQWFRGVAVRKTGDHFSVYRVDLGDIVTVPKNSLRPLSAPYCRQPPGCLQCCLVGADPKEGEMWSLDAVQMFSELINGEGQLCYPLTVEVLGKVKGGRFAVRLYGQEEEDADVANLLIKAGCARKQSQSCIFRLEAEVELELLGGKTKGKITPSGQMEVLPRLSEMVKQDARLMKEKGYAGGTGNEGKSITRRLNGQDINANVKKPVTEVTNTKEVAAKKTVEESLGTVDRKKFVKVNPHVEAEKPDVKRSFEEKPDCSKKCPLENENRKHGEVKEEKNPVVRKKQVGAKKNLEGRSMEVKPKVVDRPDGSQKERRARLNSEDRFNAEKVAECKSGKNCKWKPRCRFVHPEGGNLEHTQHHTVSVNDEPLVEKKLLKFGGTVNDKTSEIKENQVDAGKPSEEEEPFAEVQVAEGRDCVVEQKPGKGEKNVMEEQSAEVGPCEKSSRSEVKRLSRGQFPSNCNQFCAEVCHFVSPESFFLCSKEQQDKFLNMMLEMQEIQESQEGIDVLHEVGTACLAFYEKDGMFYRAEITALDSRKGLVTVFLVDHGAKVTLPGNQLRPLEPRYLEEPGCVVEAALAGVQPVSKAWSEGDIEIAGLVLSTDVPLEVEVVGEKDGKVMVNLTDLESNNLAVLLVEAGVAAAPNDLVKRDPASESMEVNVASTPLAQPVLTYGKLESGSMMVFAATSPLDLYLSTGALFEQYSSAVYPVVEEAGAKGVIQKEVEVGSRVLAHDGDGWYRAQVSSVLPQGHKAEVFLLDLATPLTVDIDSLKVASPELFDLPIMAVPVCLSGWEGEDQKKMTVEWEEKIKVLVPELFTEVEAEVVEQNSNGKWEVKVPAWEKFLVRKSASDTAGNPKGKAASLMMKMKSSSK